MNVDAIEQMTGNAEGFVVAEDTPNMNGCYDWEARTEYMQALKYMWLPCSSGERPVTLPCLFK